MAGPYLTRLECEIVDINGDHAECSMPISLAHDATTDTVTGLLGTFAGLVAAATNGKIIKQSYSVLFSKAQLIVGTAPPNNAEYSSVTDGARMQFANTDGSRGALTIPAPLEALFGVSSNVIDSTQAQVAPLIAFYVANAHATASGPLLNLYKGGVKTGKGTRRRRSALVP
jgi:hypothetical protein